MIRTVDSEQNSLMCTKVKSGKEAFLTILRVQRKRGSDEGKEWAGVY